jgi:two-component system phosphate regulon sensor histidine kinase PhoR
MMGPGKLFWKLFLWNAALMVAVMAALLWFIVASLDRSASYELTEHLKAHALTVRQAIAGEFDIGHAVELDRFARTLGAVQGGRLRYTFILADGTVLADSEADAATMESHAGREEVRQALADGSGETTRFSHTLSRDMRYVTVRMGTAEAPSGVVRVAMPVRTIAQESHAAHRFVWAIGFAGLLAVVLLAFGLARLWTQPIRRITITARGLSRGDLTARVPVTGSDELATLARSLNQMRDRLAVHLEMIDRQRRTLESLLAQLGEGVVVAGPDGRIVLMNPAAVRLLGLSALQRGSTGPLERRTVEQCIAQHELQNMLHPPRTEAGSLSPSRSGSDQPADGASPCDVRLQVQGPDGALSLLARASDVALPAFSGSDGERREAERSVMGRVLVLTDVTELTRVIQVKTDFAANASHELRTPLSAIRAAVETLLQMDPEQDAASVKHFLGVIDRHSERMQAMVADLLDLSRLESSSRQYDAVELDLPGFLAELQARHEDALRAKGLHWACEVSQSLQTIVANPYLLRLVLDNLVDNAIKFTDAGGSVRITITCRQVPPQRSGSESIAIEVADTGCGIPEEEQDRVFERFYQVERARSGAIRGTGLGLSIVRHAVAAMRGCVALQSKVDEGTRVTAVIPQDPRAA